jgi:hypothetical protein
MKTIKFNYDFKNYKNFDIYFKSRYDNDNNYLDKKWFNQFSFSDLELWSIFNEIYNELKSNTKYDIDDHVYINSLIKYIKYINENINNIAFNITNYWSLLVLVIQKKKNYKNFNEYYKDKQYYKLYKDLRNYKKTFNYKDLFNCLLKRYTRYNKYFGLYNFKKNQINKTNDQLEKAWISIMKLSYDNWIIHNPIHNELCYNTNRIIFYTNWIWIYDNSWKVIKTFTYKNNINILDYIKL